MIRAALILLATAGAAQAHDAPTGWSFDAVCCSNRDCGEVPGDWVTEGPSNITIVPTGERLLYSDKRIRRSKDDRTYWCRPPGEPQPKTICVYLPDKGV